MIYKCEVDEMLDIKEDFKQWLIKKGYKEKTRTNRPGSVYDYLIRNERICTQCKITWEQLALDLYTILSIYAEQNAKIYVRAITKFNEFLYEQQYRSKIIENVAISKYYNIQNHHSAVNKGIMCLQFVPATHSTPPHFVYTGSEAHTTLNPTETAKYLGITTKTLREWRNLGRYLAYITVDNEIRYPIKAINEFLEANFHPVTILRKK